MTYTIQTFAARFNVSEHTIRYYTDIGLLPCGRDRNHRRVFNEESENWMQGILCLKGCGASVEAIQEYGRLCREPETRENLQARYRIILEQRDAAYRRLKEAQATVAYMEAKVAHYEAVLAGKEPDDTNPARWTRKNRPQSH